MHRAALVVLAAFAAGVAFAAPPPEAVLRKEAGNYYLKQRQYEDARDQYLAALQVAPDYEDAHYNLGVVYFFRIQDYRRALYHFVRYAELKPQASDLDQVRALTAQALEKVEAAERDAYALALETGTPAALRAFLERHPSGPYAADARAKLARAEAYEDALRKRAAALEAAYQDALAQGTPDALDAFLVRYPDAPQAAEARNVRARWLAQREADREAFAAAQAAGSVAAWEQFIAARPESPLAAEARAELERLRAADDAYRIAAEARSATALELFLETYPGSRHQPAARALLAELRSAEDAARGGEAAWQTARSAGTREGYEQFLAAHPDHPRAAAARAAVAELGQQRDDWEQAQERDSANAYELFLIKHPAAPQAERARTRLAELARRDSAERERRETAAQAATRAWREAEGADTLEAYEAFLAAHPNQPQAEEARRRIAVLGAARERDRQRRVQAEQEQAQRREQEQRQAQEQEQARASAWEGARGEDSREAYRDFLTRYEDGEEADAARRRLEELDREEAERLQQLPRSKRRALERYRRQILSQ